MKNQYLLIALLLISNWAVAQENPPGEYIFFTTATVQKGKIESADEDKIMTILENGSRWPGQRDKFMIFFNKYGSYITEKAIAREADKAQKQIQNFYNEQADTKGFQDVIFKAIPREVIPCTISKVLDDAVNYLTVDGKSASVNRDNVFAIIRRDGTFEVMKDTRDISEVADNLTSMEADFKKLRLPATVAAPQAAQVLRPTTKPSQPAPVVVDSKPETTEVKRLSAEDQTTYQAKSIDKMQELASLLNDIVDARKSRAEKDDAIKKVLKMFVKGAKVEVSAVNNTNNKSSRPVEDYLDRLSRLNYSKVKITYAELNFIDEFAPDDQGNFYGMASYVQTFETNSFRDLTPKRQKIKLEKYEKTVDGTTQQKFNILLGNISINVSQ